MSAKQATRPGPYRCLWLTLIIGAGMIGPSAQASDFMDTVSRPWIDPLLTRPPVLESPKALPGDASAPLCPLSIEELDALTLAAAVDLALCHNPQVQSAWAAIKVQAAALGEARSAYLPTLTASTSRLKDRTTFPNSSLPSTVLNSGTVYGNLGWRLFDFGGRNANRRAANALLDAALANHDAVLQKTLTGVIASYFDGQTALASWQSKQKNEALARQTLETTQRREARGAGSQTDTLQAATALARASLDKSRAQGAYQKALSILVYSLGLPSASHLTLAEDVKDDQDHSFRRDLDVWLEQVQTQHPAVVAARSQLEAAREKVISTRSEGLPTVDVTGSFYQNGRPNQGLTSIKTHETILGVALNIPLFDGFSRTYKVRGAQAQVEQKEAEVIDTTHQVLMEVVKAHADASAALENLSASQTLLTAAQSALSTVQRKFDKGASDILEILSTQSALSEAQQERIRCLADWRSARLRLMASAGDLGRSSVMGVR